MTLTEKKLAFVSFCIEEYKTLKGCSGRETIDLFEHYGVIDYLLAHYDVLHSMGDREILADIDELIPPKVATLGV